MPHWRSTAVSEFVTIPEIYRRAQQQLSKPLWDYAAGASETEASLRRNRWGLDALAFRPRVLRGVEHRSPKTTFLGHELPIPVMFGPVGGIARFHPAGALAVCQAAERFGTAAFVSTVASPPIEEIAAASNGLRFFQLYVYGDHDWSTDLIRRVESAGFAGLCVTVDSAVYGRRERDLTNRFQGRTSGARNFKAMDHDYTARLTWDDVAFFRSQTKLPMMLKGIMNPADAALAVNHGIEAIFVSNHGGRELDHQPATIQVLPEIVEAVAGRAEIIVDSGFRRGTDVLKAIALGARAACLGRPSVWGLAAGGVDGLVRLLELMRDEIMTDMALLGVNAVDELSPSYLRQVTPV